MICYFHGFISRNHNAVLSRQVNVCKNFGNISNHDQIIRIWKKFNRSEGIIGKKVATNMKLEGVFPGVAFWACSLKF